MIWKCPINEAIDVTTRQPFFNNITSGVDTQH